MTPLPSRMPGAYPSWDALTKRPWLLLALQARPDLPDEVLVATVDDVCARYAQVGVTVFSELALGRDVLAELDKIPKEPDGPST